ncbi:MAG: chemotaxis protein CheW [Spirochaetia bacterium]|nr:chemotaxis protein CheW [Spirochaetia bacterium]
MNNRDTEITADSAVGTDVSELKMITFSLAGKDYGIDIMQVKEISRMLDFTYIPNAPYYVRGVYNLRGEIISVIDLRLLFHLPIPEKEEAASDEDVENLIVLQFGDYYLGVVVDRVDKVCSVRTADVQAAHPLFSDISIKYINGLAHLENRLYILLNVSLLAEGESAGNFTAGGGSLPSGSYSGFGENLSAISATESPVSGGSSPESGSCVAETANIQTFEEKKDNNPDALSQDEIEKLFEKFASGLAAVCGFYVNAWSRDAVFSVFSRYIEEKGHVPELTTLNEYAQLLPFLTEQEESLWTAEYFDAVKSLSFDFSGNFNVWCSWCGYGYEAYSLAAALLSANENMRLRVWATDDDLLKISMGPNLTVQNIDPGIPLIDFAEETKNGFKFKKILAEKILFEYHSIENGNPFPKMKFIVAKGKTSFYNNDTSKKVISELCSKLESGGYILVADYETLPESDFRPVYSGSMKIYQRL